MITKLLATIENLSSNKNCSNCNTTTTNNNFNNDSETPRPKNTHLAPQWDILSTTSDTATTSDNVRSTNVIPSISIEEKLHEVRLQKDVQIKEYQRLHSEKKKSVRQNLILPHQILVS